MPFKVDNGDAEVTVLGTHFNVNTYDDESGMKVTLLQGSVKVTLRQASGNREVIIKPGQQAMILAAGAGTSNLELKTVNAVDLDQVMAWKNGLFDFGEGEDIKSVMKQIARWYDIDVKYEGPVKGHLWGTISRNVNVSEVFKLLAMTGSVKFTIDGKTVTVRQ
jgi:ferric-dicitrate binding protein FerR (iron transport regulator)